MNKDNNIDLFRRCPQCNRVITYKSEKYLDKANQKKAICRVCVNKNWRLTHPNTECLVCKKLLYRSPYKKENIPFCSYGCRNKYFSGEKSFAWKGGKEGRKIRNRSYEKEKRQKYKEQAVNLFGGKCQNCGYNKCIAALEFHHKDPNEKDFTIKQIISGGWERIEKELQKCILLCANCHREKHWNEKRTGT